MLPMMPVHVSHPLRPHIRSCSCRRPYDVIMGVLFQTTNRCVSRTRLVTFCSMVLKGFLYNTVFRRNSTYAAFIVAGAVVGEKFLNDVVDSQWKAANKGVCCAVLLLFFLLLSALKLPQTPSSFLFAVPHFHTLFRNFSMTKSSLKASNIGNDRLLTAVFFS